MFAKGTFDTAGWTPQPAYDDRDGVSLGVVTMTKTFHGDLTGTSLVTLLVVSTPVEESKAYVALERIDATLDGRTGSFTVQHLAASEPSGQSLRVSVVPDSGTGELTGIRGEMQIHIAPDGTHSYVLDYTRPD
ncbi:DUF3224 domain-containing protein [Nonomuraea typhae]|uniref:DUF3224 domain-containing protein n=1 Tax=Nonomuraea typhae TaxID=2603600 RepID=UPI0012FBC543|nr:DUF3224 domain-containing protein [Nonomuraea typhae]